MNTSKPSSLAGRREKKSLYYRAHRYKRQRKFDEPLLHFYTNVPVYKNYFGGGMLFAYQLIWGVFRGRGSTVFSVYSWAYGKKDAVKKLVKHNLQPRKYE